MKQLSQQFQGILRSDPMGILRHKQKDMHKRILTRQYLKSTIKVENWLKTTTDHSLIPVKNLVKGEYTKQYKNVDTLISHTYKNINTCQNVNKLFTGKIIIFFVLSFNPPLMSPILLFYICRKISYSATERLNK